MAVNKPLLRKVRKLITEVPKRFNMKVWGVKKGTEAAKEERQADNKIRFPECGTVACLAGWTVLASKPKKDWNKQFTKHGSFKNMEDIPATASKLLGTDRYETEGIFWDTDLTRKDVIKWIDEKLAE